MRATALPPLLARLVSMRHNAEAERRAAQKDSKSKRQYAAMLAASGYACRSTATASGPARFPAA